MVLPLLFSSYTIPYLKIPLYAGWTDEKKKVLSYIDEKADVIIDTSDKIWDFAELSLREFKSGELYARVLKEEGFEVEHPFCGIETAPRRLWPQPWPLPLDTSSSRLSCPATWERPVRASYSARIPITGFPEP